MILNAFSAIPTFVGKEDSYQDMYLTYIPLQKDTNLEKQKPLHKYYVWSGCIVLAALCQTQVSLAPKKVFCCFSRVPRAGRMGVTILFEIITFKFENR